MYNDPYKNIFMYDSVGDDKRNLLRAEIQSLNQKIEQDKETKNLLVPENLYIFVNGTYFTEDDFIQKFIIDC